jgi:hypothetical protein
VLTWCDVHLDIIARRQWSDIPKIERVAVRVRLTIFPVEREGNARGFAHGSINRNKAVSQLLKRQGFDQSEVEVLRKTVIAKVTQLQCASALECNDGLDVRFRDAGQKPCEAVVSFEYVLAESPFFASRLDRREILR